MIKAKFFALIMIGIGPVLVSKAVIAERPHLGIEYPLTATKMALKRVGRSVEITKNVAGVPMFIVGYDRISYEWLKANGVYLKKVGAIGFVISARSASDVQEIRDITNIANIHPIKDETLSESFGLRWYPAFVNPRKGLIKQ